MRRAVLWIFGQDRRDAEHRLSRSQSLRGGLVLDLLDESLDTLLIGLVREVLPAGELREHDGFLCGIAVTVESLSPAACRVFLAAVEPIADQGLAVQESADAMDARPIP